MTVDVFPDCLWASERGLAALGGGVSGDSAGDAPAACGAAGMDGAA